MTQDDMDDQLQWLSNMGFKDGAPSKPSSSTGQSEAAAQVQLAQWLSDKIIGPPKAAEKYTVEQLERMGIRGVYAR